MSNIVLVLLTVTLSVPHGAFGKSLSLTTLGDEMPFEQVLEDTTDTLESLKVSGDLFPADHAVSIVSIQLLAVRVTTSPCPAADDGYLYSHFCRPPPIIRCAGSFCPAGPPMQASERMTGCSTTAMLPSK